MPTVVQWRRGTTTQNNNFTGALGEISVDTTLNTVRVHDGSTVGGFALLNEASTQTLSNKTLSAPIITGTLSASGLINTTGNISAAVINTGTLNVSGTATATTFSGTLSGAAPAGSLSGATLAAGVTASSLTSVGTLGALGVTGTVTAGAFSGPLTGATAGTHTGAVIGNASSATVLQTARAINGVNFDGSAAITVTAAAGTLTGATLNSGVTASSLTSVGTLAGVTVSSTIAANANNTINIGAAGTTFATVYATTFSGVSTTAKYADLAENYSSDKKYVPGTVVIFGGNDEITISTASHDPAVAGVVSTDPAYLMNSSLDGLPVALQGRVPCRVQGPVKKGDRLVTSDTPGVACKMDKTLYEPGCIIGKALEDILEDRIVTIEVVVGRV